MCDDILIDLSNRYENADFLNGDPSWFMHQVSGKANKEIMALIASSLSYGSRKQFIPKIQFILDSSQGDLYNWILSGKYNIDIPNDDVCYYRLHTRKCLNIFLKGIKDMLTEYNTIGEYVKEKTKMFVTRGLGSHTIRFRLFNMPQIHMFSFKNK